jgi:hypothetical protein
MTKLIVSMTVAGIALASLLCGELLTISSPAHACDSQSQSSTQNSGKGAVAC